MVKFFGRLGAWFIAPALKLALVNFFQIKKMGEGGTSLRPAQVLVGGLTALFVGS